MTGIRVTDAAVEAAVERLTNERVSAVEAPTNEQLVGVRDGVVVVGLVHSAMTPTQALEHAAWLVATAEAVIRLAGLEDVVPSFPALLAAVRRGEV